MKKFKFNDHLTSATMNVIAIIGMIIIIAMFMYGTTHIQHISDDSNTIETSSDIIETSYAEVSETESADTEFAEDIVAETEIEVSELATAMVTTEETIADDMIWDSPEVYDEPEYIDVIEEPYYSESVEQEIDEYIEPELPDYEFTYDCIEAIYMAKTVNVEAPYCSTMEQAAVMWCILNRVDNGRFGNSIIDVIARPYQFGYYDSTPLRDDLYSLALDVLNRWYCEKEGYEDVGRVLPIEYLYFWGDGQHNHFRINETDQWYWDWSLHNPYASEIWDMPTIEVIE